MSGTKVTSEASDPKVENPGVVTSDSLAAESIEEGGSFAATSDSRGPMSVPSSSTTANTTDTSNAIRLEPAVDAEARQASEEWNETAQLNAGRQLRSDIGTADATSAASDIQDVSRPKGKNLQEGGFDADAPNASFNQHIGDKKDPARVALQKMEADNTPSAGGAGPRQDQVTGDGQFDVLKDASA